MAERVKQTIIISKSHPLVKDRKDAEKIARHYADKIYTSRETSSSYRFRQRPPSDFVEGSFKTEKINEYISIVWGELKKKVLLNG